MIHRFLSYSPTERREIIGEAASRLGVRPIIIEKDLWVCAVLQLIFGSDKTKDLFVFKGGTSLSKVYNAIHRFSEDIDLILDWEALGYGKANLDPWEPDRSRTKQEAFNKALNAATREYLQAVFLPWLKIRVPGEVHVSLSPMNDQAVDIHYPGEYSNTYIESKVLLEIGPLAAWIPSDWKEVQADVDTIFPTLIDGGKIPVRVTSAKRTFWEKATIAHQVAYSKNIPARRYSRHYYDLYMLQKKGIAKSAMTDLELLKSVREFKARFYPSSKARYDLAKPGTLKLIPSESSVKELATDYKAMEPMFFSSPPSWTEILSELRSLEAAINDLPV